jgi:hypothetical protein
MKKIYLRALMFVALGATMTSCSKDGPSVLDPGTKLANTAAADAYELSFGGNVADYPAGTDAGQALIFPNPPDDPYGGPKFPYAVIGTPTPEYLKETCLVDISKLENNKTYHAIQNGKLTIGFFSGPFSDSEARLLKLKSSSETGWNAAWGQSPNVQSENPDVLYTVISRNELIIYLSKPCIEFGFEIAPNHKNYDHRFGAEFGDWIFDANKGSVSGLVTRSPSGARLLAVKSTEPFTMITVRSSDSPTGDEPVEGFAIANIRYKLAK